MGTQFFWFYDLLVAAIILGITFKGIKRGFVASLVSLGALIAAFLIGMILSGLITSAVYDNVIKKHAVNYIEKNFGSIADIDAFEKLSEVDLSKIIINEVNTAGEITRSTPLPDIDRTPDTAGKIEINLSNVDLSQIGIDKLGSDKLEFLGINPENLSDINAGRVVISSAELTNCDFEALVLAKILTGTIRENADFDTVAKAAAAVGDFLPQISGSFNNGTSDAISQVVAVAITSEGSNLIDSLLDGLVKPLVTIPLRTLIFFILFAIICIVAAIFAKKLSIINRIPLIGPVNSALGGAVGLLKSIVIIVLVCIGLNILITVTGNNIIFINTMTVDETLIFKHIFYFEPLKF
ncbi:MAG: CvpA family protein [Oscillospiraceae bacterium]|nr:CvpA family protein [Oscillospiraceae bacterium]